MWRPCTGGGIILAGDRHQRMAPAAHAPPSRTALRAAILQRNDIGHTLIAIFAHTVLDNLVAAGVLDVNVDVWHADAVGVKEALRTAGHT